MKAQQMCAQELEQLEQLKKMLIYKWTRQEVGDGI